MRTLKTLAALGLVLPLAWACASDGQGTSTEGEAGASAGVEASGGGSTGTSGGGATSGSTTSGGTTSGGTTSAGSTPGGSGSGMLGQIPSLVSVNLQNVLNDLAIRLNIDRANIPVNAQIPINVAANVCGVSINILSVSTGGQAQCTARTASAELAQSVQQQVAAGGNVGGGAQGGATVTTGGTTSTSPTQTAPATQPQTQPTTTSPR